MKPHEARVLIVNNDPAQRSELTTFIEANGGHIVNEVAGVDQSVELVESSDFPLRANTPNVILIDDASSGKESHTSDGTYILRRGHEQGNLHRVDRVEGDLGAVAIAYSNNSASEVTLATGGNLNDVSDPTATTRWAELLEPHPAEPTYIERGIIERLDANVRFKELLEQALLDNPDDASPEVTILSLFASQTSNGEETVINTVTSPDSTSLDVLISRARGWGRAEEYGIQEGDSHTIKTIIQLNGYIYAIRHSSHVRQDNANTATYQGTVDKISPDDILQIPNTYWNNFGLKLKAELVTDTVDGM